VLGAVAYLLFATLSWIGMIVWRARASQVRTPPLNRFPQNEILPVCPKSAGVASRVLPSYGLIEGEIIYGISAPPWRQWSREEASLPLREARLLAPVEPSKIVCVGATMPRMRLKWATSAERADDFSEDAFVRNRDGRAIVLTRYSNHVDYEAELGVIIGKKCSQLSDSDDALSYVLGYTCLNDVSARDLQKSDVQFTRAKGFDTFCPVGPHIETQLDPRNALVESAHQWCAEAVRQHFADGLPGGISDSLDFAHDDPVPGDVIATGTPAGVGPLTAGDTVDVSVVGIGVCTIRCMLRLPDFADLTRIRYYKRQ